MRYVVMYDITCKILVHNFQMSSRKKQMSINLTRFFVIDKPSINGNCYVNRINDSKKELAL